MILMKINKYISIAIDGAAGSGKSTTSRSLCEKFNYIHVDTGLHYRSLCHFFTNINISAENVKSYLSNNTLEIDSLIDGYSCLLQINGNIYNSDLLRTECMNRMYPTMQGYRRFAHFYYPTKEDYLCSV